MQSQLNFHDYLDILYRRKFLIGIPLVIGLGVAVAISLNLPSVYRSSTTILVERQKVPEAYVKPTVTSTIEERLKTIRQQIMSRTRLERIIEKYGLYHYRPGLKERLLSRFGIELKPPAKEDVVENMRNDIKVKVIGNGAFIISYIGGEPETTMQVTDTLSSLFIEENLKIREQYAEGTSEFLASELEKSRQELERQEGAVRAFKEEHIGTLPEQLDSNLRTLDRLQSQLQTVNDALKGAKDRKLLLEEQMRLSRTGSLTELVDPLEMELINLKQGLSSLRTIYTDNYPDIIITKNRINEIEGILDARDKSVKDKKEGVSLQDTDAKRLPAELAIINSEIKMLKKRETQVGKQIKGYAQRVEDTPANEQKLKILLRDYEIMQRSYQALLDKSLNARVSENLERRQKGEQFRIIDPANLPEKPYGARRNKIMVLFIGLSVGGGIGMGFVYLVEFLNPAFRKPEDFLGVIDTPIFAAIPRFSVKFIKK